MLIATSSLIADCTPHGDVLFGCKTAHIWLSVLWNATWYFHALHFVYSIKYSIKVYWIHMLILYFSHSDLHIKTLAVGFIYSVLVLSINAFQLSTFCVWIFRAIKWIWRLYETVFAFLSFGLLLLPPQSLSSSQWMCNYVYSTSVCNGWMIYTLYIQVPFHAIFPSFHVSAVVVVVIIDEQVLILYKVKM